MVLYAKLEALGIDTVVMSNTIAAKKTIPNSTQGLNATIDLRKDG